MNLSTVSQELLLAFKDYLLKVKKSSPLTVKNYAADVAQFLRWFEEKVGQDFNANAVSLSSFDQYQDDKGVSVRSFERHLSSLRKFFTFLIETDVIAHSPFDIENEESEAEEEEDPWYLKQFKDYLYVAGAADLTIKNYIIDIQGFRKWCEEIINSKDDYIVENNIFDHVTPEIISEYRDRMLNVLKLSPNSINRKLSSIRKYFEFLESAQVITSSQSLTSIERGASISNVASTTATFAQINPSEQFESQISLSELSELTKKAKRSYSKIPPIRLFQKIFITPYSLLEEFAATKIAQALPVKTAAQKVISTVTPTSQMGSTIRNIPKEFYAPHAISTRNLPFMKKIIFHARHTRPNWYKRYHSYTFTHYFHVAILIIFASSIGFAAYTNLVTSPKGKRLASAAPVAPPRILSFQGRLTDNSDNPITTPTNIRFSIYDNSTSSGSALLWQEVQYAVAPDADGVFSIQLGTSTTIPQSVFANNDTLYLGVTIENTSELTPRQRLAAVAFATNAEVLQGLPPITQSGAGQTNVVLALDSSGNLTIGGSANPTFEASGGQFRLAGQSLLLSTSTGSNGNITVRPDGLGFVDIQRPIMNSSSLGNLRPGSVEVQDRFAILATESAQAAFVVNNNTTGGDIIAASSSGVTKLILTNSGNLSLVAGTTIDTISSGTLSLGTTTATTITIGRVGQGITLPAFTGQNGVLYGTNGTGVLAQATTASSGLCLTSGVSAPSWQSCTSVPTVDLYWNQQNGALFPNNSTVDFFVGGQATNSAKFAVLNINNGTPIASVSSGLNGNGLSFDASGVIQTTRNQTLTIGGNTTGNIILSPLNGSGNIGIGNIDSNLYRIGSGIMGTNGEFRAAGRLVSSGVVLTNGGGGTGSIHAVNNANLYISDYNNTNRLVTITQLGNVGIGTTTVNSLLHVRGTTSGNALVTFDQLTSGADIFTASQSGTTRFTITGAGNVGIGTSQPGQPLQVVGIVAATGATSGYRLGATDGSQGQLALSSSETYLDFYGATGNTGGIHFRSLNGGTAERVTFTTGGNVGIGSTTPGALLDIAGTLRASSTITFSTFSTNGGLLYTNASGVLAQTAAGSLGQCLVSNGGGAPSWTSCSSAASNYWTQNLGALYPSNSTVDLLIGGTATTSAKFAVLNVNNGTPVASISGGLNGNNGIYITADGTISATNRKTLTIGNSSSYNTTGDVVFQTNNVGNVGIGTSAPKAVLQVKAAGQSSSIPVAGTIDNTTSLYLTNLDATYGLLAGVYQNGRGWLQTQRTDGTGIAYDLVLNPNGGNVGIGTNNPAGVLQVTGTTSGNALAIVNQNTSSGDIFTASASSNTRFVIANNGQVGITSSNTRFVPTALIDARGGGSSGSIRVRGNSVGSHYFDITSTDATGTVLSDNWGYITTATSNVAGSTPIERIRVALGGFIGIGSTSPTAALDVQGSFGKGNALAIFNQLQTGTGADIFTASQSGTTRFVITGAGNVGIGTTLPAQMLQIAGGNVLIDNNQFYRAKNSSGTEYNILGITSGNTLQMVGGADFTIYTSGGGNQPFYISTGGNVGLGTTSPIGRLDVRGVNATTPTATISANSNFAALVVDNRGTGDLITASGSGVPNFRVKNNGDLVVGLNGNGKITAAVIDPYLIQNQYTSGTTQLRFQTMAASNGDFIFENQSSELIRILQNGNLGIGSATPAQKLDIAGNVKVAGDILPDANGTRNLGSASLAWNTIYANNIVAGNSGISGYWQRSAGALAPANITDDLLLGHYATSSALVKLGGTANASSYFNTGGNVGISSTSPGQKLDVTGNIRGSGFLELDNSFADARWLQSVGGTGYRWALANDGTFRVQGTTNGFSGVTGTPLFIDSSTNSHFVGISTTSPRAALDIGGSASASGNLSLRGAGTAHTFNILDNGTLNIQRSAGGDAGVTSALFIQNNGNVGLGSTTPGNKLDVAGAAYISGNAGIGGAVTTGRGLNLNFTFSGTAGGEEYAQFTYGNAATVDATGNQQGNRIMVDASNTSGTMGSIIGLFSQTRATGNGGTLGEAVPIIARADALTGATINTVYNIQVADTAGSGSVGTQYGLFVNDLLKGSTNNFAVYTNGNTKSYFGGYVGLGSTSPTARLQVSGTTTGNSLVNFNQTTSGADIFSASASGTNRFVITNSGNVGIGTSQPAANLENALGTTRLGNFTHTGNNQADVNLFGNGTSAQSGAFSSVLNIFGGGGQTRHLSLYQSYASQEGFIDETYSNLNIRATDTGGSNPSIKFTTGSTEKVTFNYFGNVGIGSTSPVNVLNVVGTYGQGNALVSLNQTQTGTGADIFTASQSGTTRFVITGTGNVGVGTAIPDSRFNVRDVQTWSSAEATNRYSSTIYSTFNGTDNNTGTLYGVRYIGYSYPATGKTYSNQRGIYSEVGPVNGGTGAVSNLFAYSSAVVSAGSGNSVSNAYGFQAGTPYTNGGSGGTFTNTYGFYASNQGGVGVTNAVGLYVAAQSGATSSNYAAIFAGGNVGISSTSPGATLDITGTLRASSTITFSTFSTNGGLIYTNGSGVLAQTTAGSLGQCLVSKGGGAPSWTSCAGASSNYWNQANGALFPNNSTVDLLIGSSATTSAKFAVLNINNGTPIASVSSGLSGNSVYITADGTIATQNRKTLTIGNSSTYNTTGDVLINSNGTGNVGIGTTTPGSKLDVNGDVRVYGTTLDSTSSTPAVDINGGYIRLGDALSNGTISNGLGIKFFDAGVNHGSLKFTPSAARFDFCNSGSGGTLSCNSNTETLSVDVSNIRVGINTTSPASALDIRGAGGGAGQSQGQLTIRSTTTTKELGLGYYTTGDYAWIQSADWGVNYKALALQPSGGNLGVGSTSPNQKLDVNGNAVVTGSIGVGTTSPSSTLHLYGSTPIFIAQNTAATTSVLRVLPFTDGANYIQSGTTTTGGSSAPIHFTSINALNYWMTIGSNGNVGIGSSAPTGVLQVTGTTTGNALVNINQNTAADIFTASSSGTPRFTITNSGNVGIGSTLPQAPLDIANATSATINLTKTGTNAGAATIYNDGGLNIVSNNGLDQLFIRSGEQRFMNRASTTEYARFSTSGYLGIGNSSPASVLDVKGTLGSGNALAIFNQIQTGTAADIITASQSGTTRFVLTGSGNIGLGTTLPNQMLNLANTGNAGISLLGDTDNDGSEIGTSFIRFSQDADAVRSILGTVQGGNLDPQGNAYTGANANATLLGAIAGFDLQFGANAAVQMTISSAGNVGIGSVTPGAKLDITGTLRASSTVTFSSFTTNGGLLYTNGSGVLAQTTAGSLGQCLVSNGGGAPSWTSCAGASSNYWNQANGALFPGNSTVDFLIGSSATTSANFAVLNNSGSGTPTATVAGNFIVMPKTSGSTQLGGNVGIGTTNPLVKFEVQALNSNSIARFARTGLSFFADFYVSSDNFMTLSSNSSLVLEANSGELRFNRGGQNINAFVDASGVGTFSIGGSGVTNARLYSETSGAKTAATYGTYINNTATSSTNSINKYGLYLTSSGNWNGTGANNYGVYVGAPTSGTQTANYAFVTEANAGNVGIGSVAPGTKLDIVGTGAGTIDLRINGRMQTGDAGNAGGIWLGSSTTGFVGENGAANIGFWTSGVGFNAFQIVRASGNVGIGTLSPTSVFHVSGSAGGKGNALAIFDQTASGANADVLTASVAGTTAFVVTKSGNVGVGSTLPGYKVDVNGDIRANGGSLFIADTAGQTASILRSYSNASSLWLVQGSTQQFLLADSVDWDRGASFQYTPGTTGAGNGRLVIGQINKNNTNFTHGITSLYTNGSERLRINIDGNIGIGSTAPEATLVVKPNSPKGNALAIFNQTANSGAADIFTASSSGTTRFVITGAGNVGIGTSIPGYQFHVNSTANSAQTMIGTGVTSGGIYGTNAGGNLHIDSQSNIYLNYFSGSTVQFGTGASAVAGQITSGGIADFGAFRDYANTAYYLDPANSATSLLVAGNVGIGTTTADYKLDVNGAIRNKTAADASPYTQARLWVYGGTNVDSTNWGYFAYGSDAVMRVVYGKSGGTPNLSFGITSAADNTGTYTQRLALDGSGNITATGTLTGLTGLTSSGTITFSTFSTNGGLLYTNGSGALAQLTGQGTAGQCLTSNGAGAAPSFGSCSGGSTIDTFWNQSSGALFPNNSTVDLLIGGQATTSAKFAVLNLANASSTPIASVSSGLNGNGMYLTADGTLATTRRQTLTIGNSSTYDTTGNVLINSNGTGNVAIGTTVTTSGKFTVAGGNSMLNTQANSGASARNFGPKLWTDNSFGMELGYNGSIWTTRILTRDSDGGIEFGKYPSGSTTNVNQFSAWATFNNSGNLSIGTTATNGKVTVESTPLTGGFTGNSAPVMTLQGDAFTAGDIVALDFRSNTSGPYGRIGLEMQGFGSLMHFGTSNNYTTGITNTAMTINQVGNIGIGSTSPASTLDLVSSATSTNAESITANSLTTGNGLAISTTNTGLTSGSLLKLSSTANFTAFTGSFGLIDWSPGSSTTGTGDLFTLNIGSNGTLGKLLNIKDSGSSVFSVSETDFTTSLPSSFTAAGDVSMAYDLNFTNPTASYINSAAPLYIRAGEVFNSSDLTLDTYNKGNVVVDSEALVVNGSATISGHLILNGTSPLGNIGIGTTNPTYGVHVIRDGYGITLQESSGGSNTYVGWRNTSASLMAFGGYSDVYSSAGFWSGSSSIPLSFGTNGNQELYINTNGNVGVGTTTVSSQFYVKETAAVQNVATFETSGSDPALVTIINNAGSGYVNQIGAKTFGANNVGLALYTGNPGISGTGIRMAIQENGNVGVGTTTIGSKFTVYTTTASDGITLNGTSSPAIAVQGSGTTRMYLGLDTAGSQYNPGSAINDFNFRTAGGAMLFGTDNGSNTLMYLAGSNGNVGIGTTTTTQKLDVRGLITSTGASGGFSVARRDTNASAWIMYSASGNFSLYNGSDQFTILTSNGNVGIGSTAPTQKLDVAGSITAQQFIDRDDTTYFLDPAATGNSLLVAGNVGIGVKYAGNPLASTSPLAKLHVYSNLGTSPAASISAKTSFAALLVTNDGAGSVIAASSSGNHVFEVRSNGDGVFGRMGTGKIYAAGVDPRYTIDGRRYSTFAPSMVGMKEEITGDIVTKYDSSVQGYAYTFDFNNFKKDSDLWVFSRVIDPNIDKVTALLSSESNTRVWYTKDAASRKITIFSEQPTKVGYRFTTLRFDHDKWPTIAAEDDFIEGLIAPPPPNPVGVVSSDPNSVNNTFAEQMQIKKMYDNAGQPFYALVDTFGNVIKRAESFSSLIAANIKAGVINAQEGAFNSLSVGGKSLRDFIVDVINQENRGNAVASPIASIEQINTDIVSPLSNDSDVSLKLSGDKLEINNDKNASGSAVATIDREGNATLSGSLVAKEASVSGNLTSDTLVTKDATVSGTLYADNLEAKNINGLDEKIKDLLKKTEENNTPSSPSGNLSYVPNSLDVNQNISNMQFMDISSISASFALIRDNFLSLGTSTFNQVSVMDSLSIGTTLSFTPSSINTLGVDLEINPLRQGNVSFLGGLVMIDTEGNLNVEGNANFAKDVTVNGALHAGLISPLADGNLIIALNSETYKDQQFEIRNASDSAVFAVNQQGDVKASGNIEASGSATFAKLNLKLVDQAYATSDTTAVATGSAGIATLKATKPEITIANSNVTEKSLIYITPVGDTNNQVLYLLRQVPGKSFTVGIGKPSTKDIQFNWIIVN